MEYIFSKIGALFAGAFGSLMALYFNRAQVKDMGNIERVFIFLCGVGIAHFLGGAAIEWWKIDPLSFIADALKFTIGLFGMSGLAQAFIQVPKAVDILRKKYIGGE